MTGRAERPVSDATIIAVLLDPRWSTSSKKRLNEFDLAKPISLKAKSLIVLLGPSTTPGMFAVIYRRL